MTTWYSLLLYAVVVILAWIACKGHAQLVRNITGILAPRGLTVCNGIIYAINGTDILKWFANGTSIPFTNSVDIYFSENILVNNQGCMYVLRFSSLMKLNPNETLLFQIEVPSAMGLGLDAYNNIYVSNNRNIILKHSANGTYLAGFTSHVINPVGMIMDGSGNIYVTNIVRIVKIFSNGTLLNDFPISNYAALSSDRLGNIYCANNLRNAILKYSPTGVQLAQYRTSPLFVRGTAVDDANNLYPLRHYFHHLL